MNSLPAFARWLGCCRYNRTPGRMPFVNSTPASRPRPGTFRPAACLSSLDRGCCPQGSGFILTDRPRARASGSIPRPIAGKPRRPLLGASVLLSLLCGKGGVSAGLRGWGSPGALVFGEFKVAWRELPHTSLSRCKTAISSSVCQTESSRPRTTNPQADHT